MRVYKYELVLRDMPQTLQPIRLTFMKDVPNNKYSTFSLLQYGTYALTLAGQLIITFFEFKGSDFFDYKLVWMPFYLISFLLTISIVIKNAEQLIAEQKTDTQVFILYGGIGIFAVTAFFLLFINPQNVTLLPLLAFMTFDLLNCIIMTNGDLSSLIIIAAIGALIGVSMYYNYSDQPISFLGTIATVGPLLYILQSLFVEKQRDAPATLNVTLAVLLTAAMFLLTLLMFYNHVSYFSAWPIEFVHIDHQ